MVASKPGWDPAISSTIRPLQLNLCSRAKFSQIKVGKIKIGYFAS